MILLAFGANLPSSIGCPQETYQQLPRLLEERGIFVVKRSSLIKTSPVPASDQPDYYNAVMVIMYQGGAKDLLKSLHCVESDLGRVRGAVNEARGVDLDLLCFHDEVCQRAECVLPHPRMQERGFVLYPLREVAPNWVHPVSKRSVNALILGLPGDQRRD